MIQKQAHISFDDVFYTLKWLNKHQPKSVYDMDFFGELRRWHECYNATFSLYIFLKNEEFDVFSLMPRYREEFLAADWLKFGFHAISPNAESEQEVQFILDTSEQFGICRTLRLHGFKADAELIEILKRSGVTELLCRDNVGVSYNLSHEESAIVKKKGFLNKDNIIYRRTDLRFDIMSDAELELMPLTGNERIVCFGHERYFSKSREKIELSIKSLADSGFSFISE